MIPAFVQRARSAEKKRASSNTSSVPKTKSDYPVPKPRLSQGLNNTAATKSVPAARQTMASQVTPQEGNSQNVTLGGAGGGPNATQRQAHATHQAHQRMMKGC